MYISTRLEYTKSKTNTRSIPVPLLVDEKFQMVTSAQ